MEPLDILIFLFPLIHLLASPYTKVEESFNIQAAHDILVYGTPTSSERLAQTYDHVVFPGAVPRSFVGALVLAGVGQPFVALAGFQHAQLIVRGLLGAFNGGSLLVFRSALQRAYGKGVARWWVVLLVTQFHLMYYLTRTLPNMFAFGLSTLSLAGIQPTLLTHILATLAFAFSLPNPRNPRRASVRHKQAIACLTFATTIFRAELAILLCSVSLHLLLTNRISLRSLVSIFMASFIAAVTLSVPVDSYFWRRWLWPELEGFYYNAILGSSSNWGTSPWHYYFSSALPRLLLSPLAIPLILLALILPATRRAAAELSLPSLFFVAIYSVQPHKEARFIFYVVPPLTAAAALAANFIFTRRKKSVLYRLSSLVLILSVPATLAASVGMLGISLLNYPGGEALAHLHSLLASSGYEGPAVSVHADVLTCMSGLTLFGQNPMGLPLALPAVSTAVRTSLPDPPVLLVDKTENEISIGWPRFWNRFEYALLEDPSKAIGNWETLGVVYGFNGFELRLPSTEEDSAPDPEAAKEDAGKQNVLGFGAILARIRRTIQPYTGGWWLGPRMSPRVHILKKLQRPLD